MTLRSIPLFACAAALALSACAPMPPSASMPSPGVTCNADAAHWAIGQAASDESIARVQMDTGSREVRVIHPGQAVTMDYRHDRVSIHVNERNAITGVTCG